MEDSYTVHRRRKAAARKREKTPEPPRIRNQDDMTGSDDDEDARSRMERMVQETEMLEAIEQEKERKRLESAKNNGSPEKTTISSEKSQRSLKRAISPEVEKQSVKTSSEETKRDKSETTDSRESRGRVATKTSGILKSPETDDRAIFLPEEKTRKSRKDADDDTKMAASPVKRRNETEASSDVTEKNFRKKTASPDADEKNRLESANNRESGDDNAINSKKTSSKVADEIERAKTTTTTTTTTTTMTIRHDENSNEQTRDNDAGLVKSSGGKSLKNVDDSSKMEGRDEREKKRENLNLDMEKSRKRESGSKRSSKDRNVEKTGYTTDSSETEEATRRALRRKKSPEGAKLRMVKKSSSRSRPTTDTDADLEEQDYHRRRNDERSRNRRRASSESDEDSRVKKSIERENDKRELPRAPSRKNERAHRSDEIRSASRSRYSNDEEAKNLKKSDTFPVDRTSEKSSRSSHDLRKQIIPLSDDSLIEDFEKAQRDYERKERGILDHDPMDDYIDPKMMAALRKRKFSIVETQTEISGIEKIEKKSWFAWVPFFGNRWKKEKLEDEKKDEKIDDKILKHPEVTRASKDEEETSIVKEETTAKEKVSFVEFFRSLRDFVAEFRAFVELNPRETRRIRILRNRCIAELLMAIIYCGLGAFVFRFTEGAFETFYKCGVKRVKRDFLDSLWNFSHNMREEDWKSMARRKLMEFEEQLHTAHEAGVHSYSGQKSWSFLNAVVYCLTVITTIGYGHISPSTTTGRAITIVYAIFGIPMFLIILADFGKLFTRGIKFLWAFVRRLYYTGSCRRVRRTVPVQEVMKGVQLVYDLATFRRPSQMNPEELEEMQKQQNQTQTVLNLDGNAPPSAQPPDTPGTPAMSTFAIDDEFNLPISVAIIILLVYIFVGATVYNFWEQWGFFESFYFVFISMSTIGFGDYVPKHPIYMMLSIVYLVFGLALTSMCINVVQVMLSDSFKQASQKIGATIGFEVAEEDEPNQPTDPPPVEVADVHMTIKESESEEQVAPKAKQEDVEL